MLTTADCSRHAYSGASAIMTKQPAFAIDKTISLDINGSRQRVRLCAVRAGLPPLLIVQHGPGFSLLHEVGKFQRRLNLEQDYLVAYWEQRGCGTASAADAQQTSLSQQVEDLLAVLAWLAADTRQRVVLFGISLGATISLLAAARDGARVKAVIANSPDLQTRAADAAVDAFLHEHVRRSGTRRSRRALTKLGPPPYLDPRSFQRRAVLLADSGTIERGKTFAAALTETLTAMLRCYGIAGAVRALRNMTIVQRRMLADVAPLDLLSQPPRLAMPVHFVFGDRDALTAAFITNELPGAIGGPGSTAIRVPDAGHMVHFDQPAIVRSITEKA
jgi:pimeloyl-ACP methyl ester carboxylesterase